MKLTNYNQLKDGIKVRCKIRSTQIDDARLSIDSAGNVFVCQNEYFGLPTDDQKGYKCSCLLTSNDDSTDVWARNITNLESVEEGFDPDNLKDQVERRSNSYLEVTGTKDWSTYEECRQQAINDLESVEEGFDPENLKNIKIGDRILSKIGSEAIIEGICGEVFAYSWPNTPGVYWMKFSEAQIMGYKIKLIPAKDKELERLEAEAEKAQKALEEYKSNL